MAERVVIEGGYVVSMDPEIGELERGSVLIEDDRIVAVERELDGVDAKRIDADGGVIMPGFVDTHRHTWQTAVRAICADWTLFDYTVGMRLTLSPRYSAEDVHIGNLGGALEALDAGVTTLLDFSHCNNSPEHADRAIAGLDEAGIRAVFAYGYFHPPMAEPHFSDHASRLEDSRRVATNLQSHQLIDMGISLTEPGLIPFSQTRAEVATARELGVTIATHTGCVWSVPTGLDRFAAAGLLGPDMVHVHCNVCDDADWELLKQSDAKISTSPETEIQMGMGHPPIQRTLDAGLTLSLSCDVTSGNSGDMFTQMRMGLQVARMDANDARGGDATTLAHTVRDAIGWATMGGAKALRMDDRIGSLTPGKQADVIVVGPAPGRLNMVAPANPVGAVVSQAGAADVRQVFVNGRHVKRDGVLVGADLTDVRHRLEASCAGVLERTGQVLPEPRGGFSDLAALLLPNFDL